MVLISPRIQFYEMHDQPWFPNHIREYVQSCLTLFWSMKVPLLHKVSPAQLVAETLYRTLDDKVVRYTFVDFCSGAGGPIPTIEKHLNKQIMSRNSDRSEKSPAQFVLTDLHPHIPDWTKITKRNQNISFIPESVDATNAPKSLNNSVDKPVYRLYNLSFHHFDDQMASDILKNSLQTSDGFGIFELQHRTISSMILMVCLGLVLFIVTPFYFWRSPGHLFYTYIIPIIPFVVVVDGFTSSLRTRTSEEIKSLAKKCGTFGNEWTVIGGTDRHTFPIGYLTWTIFIKS